MSVGAPCPQPLLCAPSTVLLLNPVEVQAEFLAVANKLSAPGHSPHSAYITLLLHAFQATFGAHCDLAGLHCRLQVCDWGLGVSPAPFSQTCVCSPLGLQSPGYTGLPHPEAWRAAVGELALPRGSLLDWGLTRLRGGPASGERDSD